MKQGFVFFGIFCFSVLDLLAIDVHFRSASVDPLTQKFTLKWQYPNPSDTTRISKVQLLEVVQDALQNLKLEVFDSIESHRTEYVDVRSNCCTPKAFALRLEPKNASEFPLFTNPFRTMQIKTIRVDDCTNSIRIAWTPFEQLNKNSPYAPIEAFSNKVEYEVFAHIGGSVFNLDSVQHIASAGNKQTLNIPIEYEKKYYHIYVAAIYNQGKDTSYSNVERLFVPLPLRPKFIRIDSLISGKERTKLYFTIDDDTDYSNFRIETSLDPNIGFTPFISFSGKHNTIIEFENVSLRFFRISSINNCEVSTYSSSAATNLSLMISNQSLSNILEWNYVSYNNMPAFYNIYRTAPIWIKGLITETTENSITDNLHTLPDSALTSPMCYLVEAIVESKTTSENHTVRSSETCYKLEPVVFMPNAIQVTSQEQNLETGKQRNLFEPVSTFKHSYRMEIYTREGQLVYKGNEAWNGREKNVGNFRPEGIYHYRIIITFAGGTTSLKQGYVTLVY
ncbi:MAG: gliding motility-associated C-terminal domain-containing protein [Bacteroidales bacterium]